MYAEPMGIKTPNSRSPQSAMRMEHRTPSEDGEEVLQPSPPVPGDPTLCCYPFASPYRSFVLRLLLTEFACTPHYDSEKALQHAMSV